MAPLRLAIDLHTLDRPGMEHSGLGRYALELTAGLAAVRPDWTIDVLGNRPALLAPPLRENVRTTRVPTGSGPGRIAWLHTVSGLYGGRRRPDVWFSPTFVLPAWRRGATVVTVHDLAFKLMPERYRGSLNARYAAAATQWSARSADRVVCGATETAELLVEHLGVERSRIAVVPYGVAEPFFAAESSPAFVSKDPYVLFVGTFEARKGLEVLFEAVRAVNAGGRALGLILAGSPGWGTEALVAEMARDPRIDIRIAPSDAELLSLHRGATALAYPSRMEGFGLPVAEAMAAGTPVIASPLPCIVEFARDAPLYAPVGDAAALAARIVELYDDPAARRRRTEAGRRMADGLRWSVVAESTARIIEVARRSHAGR